MEHGFLIPIFSGSRFTRAVLQILKSRISDSTRKFPEFRNPLHWAITNLPLSVPTLFRHSNKRFVFHFVSLQRDTVKLRRHAQ